LTLATQLEDRGRSGQREVRTEQGGLDRAGRSGQSREVLIEQGGLDRAGGLDRGRSEQKRGLNGGRPRQREVSTEGGLDKARFRQRAVWT